MISIGQTYNTYRMKKELAFDRIPVKPETKYRLKLYAVKNRMKYDEAINDLINKTEGKK